MAHPIWKDYTATLGISSAGLDFRIITGGSVVYTGRSYPRPGSTTCQACINDICADLIERRIPLGGQTDTYYRTFVVQAYIDNTWTQVASVDMTADWSYDLAFTPLGLAAPVAPVLGVHDWRRYVEALPSLEPSKLTIIHPQQYLPVWGQDMAIEVLYTDGSTEVYETFPENTFTFMQAFTAQHLAGFVCNDADRAYLLAEVCGGQVLYYINAYGGWDSIIVQGRTARQTALQRSTMRTDYDNSAYINRGEWTYHEVLTPAYTFNIGPLTTAESARMPHLLGSPMVYLHDFDQGGRIFPVTLTATSFEHKTQAGVLHTYQVEARLAAERIRR